MVSEITALELGLGDSAPKSGHYAMLLCFQPLAIMLWVGYYYAPLTGYYPWNLIMIVQYKHMQELDVNVMWEGQDSIYSAVRSCWVVYPKHTFARVHVQTPWLIDFAKTWFSLTATYSIHCSSAVGDIDIGKGTVLKTDISNTQNAPPQSVNWENVGLLWHSSFFWHWQLRLQWRQTRQASTISLSLPSMTRKGRFSSSVPSSRSLDLAPQSLYFFGGHKKTSSFVASFNQDVSIVTIWKWLKNLTSWYTPNFCPEVWWLLGMRVFLCMAYC